MDTESRIQRITDPLGNVTIVENDSAGNIIRQVSPGGATTLYTYDGNGNELTKTFIVDNNGHELIFTTTYAYDSNGNKTSITDNRGNTTYYSYNEYGQVLSIRNGSLSSSTVFSTNGLPITTADTDGNIIHFDYDERGNLNGVSNANGVLLLSNTFNQYGEVTVSTFGGRTTYYDYDINGDCIASWYFEDGIEFRTETTFNSSRVAIGTKQFIGGQEVSSFGTVLNASGKVIESTDQYGLKTQYKYDPRGLNTELRYQIKDTQGNVKWYTQRFVYDASSRLVYTTEAWLEGSSEPLSGSKTVYNADGYVIETTSLRGIVIDIDSMGRATVVTEGTVIDSSSSAYNNAGWIMSEVDIYGLKSQYTYDSYGKTTQNKYESFDENGNKVTFVSQVVYDSYGRTLLSVDTFREGIDAPHWGTQYVYDELGKTTDVIRLKGVVVSIDEFGDASIATVGTEIYRTKTIYNSKGQVYQTISATGVTTTYEYDNMDRQIAFSDSTGIRTEVAFDDLGRVVESRTIVGTDIRITRYEYDYLGNLVKTIFPDGTFITAEYDVKGHKISETNQLGQTRSFEYSDTGQLTAVILPGNLRYEYDYNIFGNQTLIRDPNGHETRFNYDENGRQLSRTLPLGFGQDGILGTEDDLSSVDYTEYFEYDDFGRTVKSISFEGVITTYHYDELDRLQSKKFYNDSVAYTQNNPSDVWNYTYDAEGRIIRLQQNDRITINAYDHNGYLISVSTPEGTLSYTYDDWGHQTSVSTNTGETTSYTYDHLGRLATVSSIAGTTSYSYDIYGNLAKTVLPNGCITTYEYDIMNRLVRLTNYVDTNNNGQMDSEEGISKFDYTLDALGRKTSAEETFWLDNNNDGIKETNIIHTSWTYDLQSRLVREVIDHYDDLLDQTLDWTYDLTGNRLTQSLDKGNDSSINEVTRYLYDANDRLIDELFDGQNDGTFEKTTSYGYDHTEQTSKTVEENNQKTSETAYEYNALGQMSVVTITKFTDGVASSREKIIYTYNADGIRVGALHEIDSNCDGIPETTTRTEYLNDANNHTGYSQVLKQTVFDSNNTVIKEIYYTIGHDQIAQTVTTAEGTQSHYFTFDGHGSTRVLLDSVSAILQIYGYDAYGNAIGFNPDQALTEYLYSGEQFDSRIGQQYLRARYYDPATGRFNSLDSFFGNLSDPQSLHKYLYAHANPVNMTDPTGLFGLGGISVSMSMMSGMNAAHANGVKAAGLFAGGVAGALAGGYSGYLQGLISYDFDQQSSAIAAVLWSIVGALAGTFPSALGLGYSDLVGAGLGAYQGAVDAALGHKDPITTAIDGLATAVSGLMIGGAVGALGRSGKVCELITKHPRVTGSILAFIS